ncbi:trypsin-like peptidase domain-containing protein [Streptomyces sp. NPDC048604]|uniref:S1C family serine protease n=1 Tax=Streptomyces sp. NPDC048604 TaxID=3365578 RepID=UPI003723A41D
MEDGKTTGRKPKWWSRPASRPEPGAEPDPVISTQEEPAPGGHAPAPTDPDGDFTLAAPAQPAPASDETAQQAAATDAAEPAPVADAEPADAAPEAAPEAAPAPVVDADQPAAVGDAVETTVPQPAPEPAQPGGDAAPVPAQPAPSHGETAPLAASEAYRAPGQPLHEPDEYSTPPYGGPGPWAPAPPVQRPVPPQGPAVPPQAQGPAVPPQAQGLAGPPQGPAVPPQGPAVPPQAPAVPAQAHAHAPAPASAHGPAPVPAPVMPAPAAPASPWVRYDPWSAPGAGPAVQAPGDGKRKRRGVGCAGLLALVLAAGILGGGVGAYIERTGGLNTVELPQAGSEDIGRAPDSVAGIAASALPSVVTIHVKGGGSAGTGTGFVLDGSGHILTNNHVVDPAGSAGDISVTFSSGETAEATLVGKDSGYDLAVVKVKGVRNLKPLPLGNSDNVRVGDPVVAIGAPFDLQNTVTSGIISAKERPITAGGEKGDGSDISYVDALQTDAPINPGNSGGPLVDSKARVIGINSAIRAAGNGDNPTSGQAGSIGLGFAIPINQGKRVAEELINTGKATHPVIGVSLDMQYTGDGARVGEKGKDGTPSVTPGGPAAQAGIRPGDVITKVDGQRVHNGEELIVKIRAHRPGDRLALTVVRGGSEQTRTLTLGSAQGS